MRRAIRRVPGVLLAAAVAAALAAGASAAVAAPRAEAACTPPQAACRVSPQCIAYCFPRGGICNQGCCACLR